MFDATTLLVWILLSFLILCAIASTVVKSLLTTTLIYMSYGLVMSIIWLFLESPDLAGTEAAVGAGVTTILFFVTYNKIKALDRKKKEEEANKKSESEIEEKEDDNT